MLTLAGKWMRLAGICLARSEITMRQVILSIAQAPSITRSRQAEGRMFLAATSWMEHNSILTVLRGKADCGSFGADQLEQRKQPRRAVFASLIYTEHNGVILDDPAYAPT